MTTPIRSFVIFMSLAVGVTEIPPPTSVTITSAKEVGSSRYRYQVTNESSKPIIGLVFGFDPGLDSCVLHVAPLGWTIEGTVPTTSAAGPPGWVVTAFTEEESGRKCVDWRTGPHSEDQAIQSNGAAEFTVVASTDDDTYLSSPVKIIFGDGSTLSVRSGSQ